jgi:acetyl-CoA carboxylase carboxyltransferase component
MADAKVKDEGSDKSEKAADKASGANGADKAKADQAARKDPGLEKQLAMVAEVALDPADTEHPSEAPSAPLTEHGGESGLKSLVDDLHERRQKAKLGGGPEKVAQQHAKGKLTARERIDLLCDHGSFVEIGLHGRPHFSQRSMEGREAPADGVITGWGRVDGRMCAVVAYDFTVMAGSMGMTGELKVTRLRELALQKRMPFIWLLDSAGARIQEAVGSLFAGSGHLFREEVTMSGVIPLVAAMLGPCAAGTAYIPGLADFVPMVSGHGSMALAGPHLVKAVTGEDVTQEELGGARIHCRKSGVGDLEVADDRECIEAIKKYLSYFPSNCEERPPIRECTDPVDRMDEKLLDVVPESPRHPYDMYEVIRRIVDDGEYFDIKPRWARTIITCFARMGGRPVGIVANQPKHLAGILENDSADKAARFINLCDAFGIPLVFLQDVPGFMVGTKVEQEGIIRHGAKMLYAVSRATVPKVTVVVRKAYGAGYYVMCGKAYEPDLVVGWPSSEISVMGAEGAVNIIFRKQIDAAEDPEATRAQMVANFKEIIDPYIAAGNDMVDDIIDPRETRPTIIRALEMSENKRVERPWKKHGVMPV